MQIVNGFFRPKGQGLVEYALILTLVGVVAIAALAVVGTATGDVYSSSVSVLDADEIDGGGVEAPEDKPGPVAVSGPAGTTSAQPSVTWSARPGTEQVTRYKVAVDVQQPGGSWRRVTTKTYGAVSVCSGSTCSATMPVLSSGDLRVRVRAENAAGWGPFGSPSYFDVPVELGKPGPVALVSPSGAAATTPTFRWDARPDGENVTQYRLRIDRRVLGVWSVYWREDRDADALCAGGSCALTEPTLESGEYRWRVRACNAQGWGPFGSRFNVDVP